MKHAAFSAVLVVLSSTLVAASSPQVRGSSMVERAAALYAKATPESFDRACRGRAAELEVTGGRHACSTAQGTTIVRFAGDQVSEVTVQKKGIQKGALQQIQRRFGKPDSVKSEGALKMHFWFTDDVRVALGFQSSKASRSTLVSFGSP